MTNLDERCLTFGEHEPNTLAQMAAVMRHAERGVLCADGHLGYVMPVGGVAAYDNQVSVVGPGFDIGCGNLAVRLDCRADELEVDRVLDTVEREISFGVGQTNPQAPRDHELFDDARWAAYGSPRLIEELKTLARNQLGTVGGGNHYVDLFEDERGRAWIGVHFGSRRLGHKTATGFLNLTQDKPWQGRAKEVEGPGGRRCWRAGTRGRAAATPPRWACAATTPKPGASGSAGG